MHRQHADGTVGNIWVAQRRDEVVRDDGRATARKQDFPKVDDIVKTLVADVFGYSARLQCVVGLFVDDTVQIHHGAFAEIANHTTIEPTCPRVRWRVLGQPPRAGVGIQLVRVLAAPPHRLIRLIGNEQNRRHANV